VRALQGRAFEARRAHQRIWTVFALLTAATELTHCASMAISEDPSVSLSLCFMNDVKSTAPEAAVGLVTVRRF